MILRRSRTPFRARVSFRRVPKISGWFLVWAALAVNALAAETPSSAPLDLRYHLRLLRPTTHLLEIAIVAAKVSEPTLDLVMPAWSPGRYAIYDFAKNVQEFEARGAHGQTLPWTKVDKQTWRVQSREAGGTVQVRYRVFANDLSGTFSQYDSSHANLNGASLYMYVAGHKQDSLTLTVDASPTWDPTWKLIGGFSESTSERTFRVPNYDLLVDTPIEISDECSLDEFRERGKTIRVAVHSYADQDGNGLKLLEGIRQIVRSQFAMMPEPEFEHYTFIFHFAPHLALGDGMEHLNSTQIVIARRPSGEGLAEAWEFAAHEFFHLWNVKRLRPAGLGPFDYTRETYTRSLWFVEGVTSYYAYLHLLRSGVWSREKFLKRLADEIRNLEAEPGRALMSAESSSFDAWFYDRAPQMVQTGFANTTINYYNKGAILGMLLDLEIRSRTGGRKHLDDVLRGMYRSFYETPAAKAHGSGRGYEPKDILEAVNHAAGDDLSPFFERYVRGTDPLPYARTLALAGLQLRVASAPGSGPSLGVLTQRQDRGLKIVAVRPGGAADRAGLSRDDLLIAVDDHSLSLAGLEDCLKSYSPGAELPLTLERHGRLKRISVKLDPPLLDQCSIEELAEASAEQIKIREGWLGIEK